MWTIRLLWIISILFCLNCMGETKKKPPRSQLVNAMCYIADSIHEAGSNRHMVWRNGHTYPIFGFPYCGVMKTWRIYITPYKGISVLQFAHGVDGEKCRFLTRRPNSDVLALTEAKGCHPEKMTTDTLFATALDTLSNRRHISFYPLSDEFLLMGYRRRNVILTPPSNEEHLVWWIFNLSETRTCQ